MGLVYQNIEESYYKYEINDITFYFSSSFNLRRFKEKCIDYSMLEERKIKNRYHVNINMKEYFLLSLYKTIEKRGFLIKYNNELYKDDIQLETIIK